MRSEEECDIRKQTFLTSIASEDLLRGHPLSEHCLSVIEKYGQFEFHPRLSVVRTSGREGVRLKAKLTGRVSFESPPPWKRSISMRRSVLFASPH